MRVPLFLILFFPFSSFVFLPFLILGIFIAISSSSWFGAWLGLELNLLSFIPMIAVKINSFLSETALKYFLIQALGSAIIIIARSLYLSFLRFPSLLLLTALLLKIGASPFHFWFPQIVRGLQWFQTIIILTIQKISPIILLSYIIYSPLNNTLIVFSAISSALVGAFGGFNTLNLRKIIAFSSINHIAWILISFYINTSLWVLYFLFYSLISTSIVLIFYFLQSYSLSNLITYFYPLTFFSFLPPISLLSLRGLPPFSGFIPKWIIIQAILQQQIHIILFFLLRSTLITLFFYLRISIPFFLIFNSSLAFSLSKKTRIFFIFFLLCLIFFNLLGLFFPLWTLLI